MEKEERNTAIKNIIKSSRCRGHFVDYRAKYFLACMIDSSQPYFNGLGYWNRVKEFDKLGWYDDNNQLNFSKIME
jgi:hypothetical protein